MRVEAGFVLYVKGAVDEGLQAFGELSCQDHTEGCNGNIMIGACSRPPHQRQEVGEAPFN